MEDIKNTDLYKTKYNCDILIKNINKLNLQTILETQLLSIDFCIDYILNKKLQYFSEENDIGLCEILETQKHISKDDLLKAIEKKKSLCNINYKNINSDD